MPATARILSAKAPGSVLAATFARTAVVFLLAYLLADFALNYLTFKDGWTIVWPLNGITIAILIAKPRKSWPAILLGVGIGTGIGEWLDGNSLPLELGARLISLLEILLCALILPSFRDLDSWLAKPLIFPRFLLALLVGPGVAGIFASVLYHHLQNESYVLAFDHWAIADALGIALSMPLALACPSPEFRSLFAVRALPKTLCLLTFTLATVVVAFSNLQYPLLFLTFPVLLLAVLLLGFEGIAIALFATSFVAVTMTLHGQGVFGAWPTNLPVSRDVALQLFLGFHTLALFPLSIVFRERHRANSKLAVLASLDSLTGVANRREFDTRYERERKRAIRLQSPIAVIMIDVDFFKEFNDRYGHPAGDRCLVRVAETLALQAKRPQDLVCRFGGEEFAILLPHTTLDGAQTLAETMRRNIFNLNIPHAANPSKAVTVSLGCAAGIPALHTDGALLIGRADQALYEAKAAGRNQVSPELA